MIHLSYNCERVDGKTISAEEVGFSAKYSHLHVVVYIINYIIVIDFNQQVKYLLINFSNKTNNRVYIKRVRKIVMQMVRKKIAATIHCFALASVSLVGEKCI